MQSHGKSYKYSKRYQVIWYCLRKSPHEMIEKTRIHTYLYNLKFRILFKLFFTYLFLVSSTTTYLSLETKKRVDSPEIQTQKDSERTKGRLQQDQ